MIGPFKPVPGNFKFVFVLIDKFSKLIEYMPLVKASSKKAVKFLDQVIHRFGIPNSIITDLRTQFTGNTFWDFCDERSIVVKYVSVAHPRANGQVERANGMILDALKKRMYRENDKALDGGLRSYRPWSGDFGHSLVAILVSLHISWFTTQRLCSQQTLSSGHLGSRTTMKIKLQNNVSSR
jgi:hypothetical protein